jgi:signal transduction histidine kinase
MKIFDAAYVRLTGWYVAIIMVISLLFSVWVYNQAAQELRFGLSRLNTPMQQGPFEYVPTDDFRTFLEERLQDSHRRLVVRLVGLNIAVLLVGAGASYWLARRTMRPIEEAVEAQHRFTADASHELRTPLAAMKTEIEVGLRDKNLSKQEAVDLLQSNLEEIDRLGTLADGLLTLTQTTGTPTMQPVSLEEVTGRVAKRLQPLADKKQIVVKRELTPVVLPTDAVVVDKIVGILLDNAIKYSPEQTTITLSTAEKDGHGCVSIVDQGIGIKASELPHIFDRFYRADTSRSKTHVPGNGLGLSIAQKLAENIGGHITVTSAPGAGSTFVLRIEQKSYIRISKS